MNERVDIEEGRPFPAEFIGIMAGTALETVEKYLQHYQIPEVVIKLLRDLIYVKDLNEPGADERHPGGKAGYRLEVQEAVSRLTWEIVRLGGEFVGAGSASVRRPAEEWIAVAWEFPKAGG